jgi:sulfur-carrier protein
MITVQAKLFATLRQHRPGIGLGEPFAVDLPQGATVGDLIQELALPEREVKLVFVNGRLREKDHVLADGDQLGIFPPVGGG